MFPCNLEFIGLNDFVVRTVCTCYVCLHGSMACSVSRLCYNFALTSISERFFLYDIMGGSLKISPRNGCCCIKCHLLIRTSLGFGTVGQYCVTKGKIRLFIFPCQRTTRLLPSNFTFTSGLSMKKSGQPLYASYDLN